MTTPIAASTETTSTYPSPSLSQATNTAIDRDTFLKLMVTQLKYQDPMNPAKTDDFLAQTAQFTMVEKLTELADQATASALFQRLSTAGSFVGRTVTYVGATGDRVDAQVKTAALTDDGGIELTMADGTTVGAESVRSIGTA
jgi:flagellar basal-body rod modification protein FlgD